MTSRFVAQVLGQVLPSSSDAARVSAARDQIVGRHFNQRSTQHLSVVLALQDDGDAVLFGFAQGQWQVELHGIAGPLSGRCNSRTTLA